YLVTNGNNNRVDLTLPTAATAKSRFVTVRRVDDRGRVIIRTAGEMMEGGREIRDKSGDSNAIALETRWDWSPSSPTARAGLCSRTASSPGHAAERSRQSA